ncbi:hypothetical protein GEOBRER4_n0494 [Citrifermentans bremense]|uniref:Uncharacterized protein n=1 Tax=Citrifermentans bremense TaxID=60035 RepID=A0A6S6LWN1_9BACT|nr:hypothetical protein [Citrifermentans bremense]BCG45728.1 hypothetical protein GEOBRER4_n0494 [Citrifermentans bremense]
MEWEREWVKAVAAVDAVFQALPQEKAHRLHELSRAMVALKERMQRLVEQVEAAESCAGCGGACCVCGKYHFSAADLLAYRATGEPLFSPRFDNGLCPYLGEPGCLIPPGYRPFNCITFNCELIEDRLAHSDVSRFYLMERELKGLYAEIRSLFPGGAMDGPLLRHAVPAP